MILFIAKVNNQPFFQIGDGMVKDAWLETLNLDEAEFQVLIDNESIEEIETDLKIGVISCAGTIGIFKDKYVSKEEGEKIIANIRKAFPNLEDLLK